MTRQDQIFPTAPPKSAAARAADPPPSGPRTAAPIGERNALARLAIPLFVVIVALAFVAVATLRWDGCVGSAAIQTTDDADVRAELTD